VAEGFERFDTLDRVHHLRKRDRNLGERPSMADLVHPHEEPPTGVVDLRLFPHHLIGLELDQWQAEKGSQ